MVVCEGEGREGRAMRERKRGREGRQTSCRGLMLLGAVERRGALLVVGIREVIFELRRV